MKKSHFSHSIKDPVCLSTINNPANAVVYRYNGRIITFCSSLCCHKFLKNPQHFLSGHHQRKLPPRMRPPLSRMRCFHP
jgi:YHS domain-containing protein